jgi:Zinc knuckle
MEVDANRQRGPQALVCYRCGKTGHTRRDCPQAFDVRYMTVDEREDFLQQELAAMDVRTASSTIVEDSDLVEATAKDIEAGEEGFGGRNE